MAKVLKSFYGKVHGQFNTIKRYVPGDDFSEDIDEDTMDGFIKRGMIEKPAPKPKPKKQTKNGKPKNLEDK